MCIRDRIKLLVIYSRNDKWIPKFSGAWFPGSYQAGSFQATPQNKARLHVAEIHVPVTQTVGHNSEGHFGNYLRPNSGGVGNPYDSSEELADAIASDLQDRIRTFFNGDGNVSSFNEEALTTP